MAEYFGGPLWARPDGPGGPVDVSTLGVPVDLVDGLLEWNTTYERLAVTDVVWQAPPTEQEWTAEGARLSAALQEALPTVEVRYQVEGVAVPVVPPRT